MSFSVYALDNDSSRNSRELFAGPSSRPMDIRHEYSLDSLPPLSHSPTSSVRDEHVRPSLPTSSALPILIPAPQIQAPAPSAHPFTVSRGGDGLIHADNPYVVRYLVGMARWKEHGDLPAALTGTMPPLATSRHHEREALWMPSLQNVHAVLGIAQDTLDERERACVLALAALSTLHEPTRAEHRALWGERAQAHTAEVVQRVCNMQPCPIDPPIRWLGLRNMGMGEVSAPQPLAQAGRGVRAPKTAVPNPAPKRSSAKARGTPKAGPAPKMSAKARGKQRAAEPAEVDVEAQDDAEAARPNKRARSQRAPKAKATRTRARRAPPASEPVIQATPAPPSPPISGAGPMQAVTKEAKREHLDLQLAAMVAAMDAQSAAVLAAIDSQSAAARRAPTRPDSATGPTRAAPSLPGHGRLLELRGTPLAAPGAIPGRSRSSSSAQSGTSSNTAVDSEQTVVGEDAVLESAEGEKPAAKASRKRKVEVVEEAAGEVPEAKRTRVSTRERKPSTLALAAAAENERAAMARARSGSRKPRV